MAIWSKKLKNNFLVHFLALFAIAGLVYLIIYFFNLFDLHQEAEVHFFIFIATVAIALVAYYEFNRSHRLTSNEFLLFISNRWSSKEIIKARQILHEIFVGAYRDENGQTKTTFNAALFSVSETVLNMSRSTGIRGENFIYLLNLLDYLETLSYFYIKGDLDLLDIENTCGNNLIFFHESFKQFIEQRRSHDTKFYLNFEKLNIELVKKSLEASSK